MANQENEQSEIGLKAPSSQGEFLCPDQLEKEFQRLRGELQDAEFKTVTGAELCENQVKTVQDRLYRMIDYTVKRHDWYVDQCHRLLQIGLALIATASATAAIFQKLENLPRPTQYLAWLFVVLLFGTGLILVLLYNNYLSGNHPYRKVVDIHSWYFAYRFPRHLDPNLDGSPTEQMKQVADEKNYIASYFTSFINQAKSVPNMIREDIEQVAILLILQRYRAQQVKEMAKYLFRGLSFSFVVLIFLILSLLFLTSPVQSHVGAAATAASDNSVATRPPAAPSGATRDQSPTKPAPDKTAPRQAHSPR